MKKITFLALHLGYGGIERCITTLANALSNNYDVEIVSTYKLYEKPGFKVNENVLVKYLINDLKPNKEEFTKALKKFNLINIIKEGFKSIKILHLRKKLMVKYIKNCDSDIIISTRDIHNLWLGKYGNKNSLKIGWEHNHHQNNKNYINKIIKSVVNLDYLVLVSKELNEFYKDKVNCKTIYIPNSIDYFPPIFSSKDNLNLVSVGRLSPEKGYLDLIDVFKLVNEKNNNIHLDIIGDGFELNKIKDKIKNYNLDNNITLHGYQNRDYINKILSNSSINIMCSYTESFGIVVLEAGTYAIPTVAFDSAKGVCEIIKNGINGYLIENRNKQKMAETVLYLFNNKQELIKSGENMYKTTLVYDIHNIVKEWSKIFNEK